MANSNHTTRTLIIISILVMIVLTLLFWVFYKKPFGTDNTPASTFTDDKNPTNFENETKSPEITAECDILGDEQKETLEVYEKDIYYTVKVKDRNSQKIILEKDLSYLRIDDWMLTDIDGDGKNELYIDGSGDGKMQKDLFRFSDQGMTSILNLNHGRAFFKGIQYKIEENQFTCSYLPEDTTLGRHGTSLLPKKLFSGVKNGEDPNQLLHSSYDWTPLKKDTTWYINATATIQIKVGQFYWGPPVINPRPDEYTDFYCDIARLHTELCYENLNFKPAETKLVMNYPEDPIQEVDSLLHDEASFHEDISLDMPIKDIIQRLGGEIVENEYELYDTVKIINGIRLTSFVDGTIINISVDSEKYPTTRGLKVGDSIETLKSLYGIPDQGFFEDNLVIYYFSWIDDDQETLNYYRKMYITLKDEKVASIGFDQMASD